MDGDLNGQNLVVEEGGGVFQVGPTESFVHRIEISFADLRASGNELNLRKGLGCVDWLSPASPSQYQPGDHQCRERAR